MEREKSWNRLAAVFVSVCLCLETMWGCGTVGEVMTFPLPQASEEADTSMWKVAYEGASNPTDFQKKADDAHGGETAFHFWSDKSDMDFSVEQELTSLPAGTYKLSAFAQGGDVSDDCEMELYAITADGELADSFVLSGWADWKNPTISGIKVTDSLVIGVRMKCNMGSWGTVDDFALNRVSD